MVDGRLYACCMWTRLRLLAALSVLVNGCASAPERTYSGPEQPLSEVAVLHATTGADILEIDGTPVSSYSFALLPGTHDILDAGAGIL